MSEVFLLQILLYINVFLWGMAIGIWVSGTLWKRKWKKAIGKMNKQLDEILEKLNEK